MGAKKILLLVVVVAAALALYFGGGSEYLTLARMQSLLGTARAYVDANPLGAALGFGAIYIIVTALSLPGATLLTLFCGAVFGLWQGLLIASFASSIGATLAMLVSRYVLRDSVRARFGERLKRIDAGIEREGGFYLFALRLVPVFPFFVINLAMGLTAIRAWTFYWVSQLGMLAGTFVYVNAGRELGELESLSGILSPGLLLAFAALGLLPLVARKALDWLRARKVYAGWDRPRRFDRNLVVIGAGAAGLVTSYIAATVRAKVTLIEKAEMGGDCLNRGCVPSKALIRAARAAAEANEGGRFGMQAGKTEVDFAKVMQHVRESIRTIEPHDSPERYRKLGVEVIHGEAKLVSPWEVEVDGRTLSARHIVIATGARPFVPPIDGLDGVPYRTSDTIWDLDALPKRLLVLGGGPIGCELAQSFARLGSETTLVEMADQLLGREDADAAAVVQAALEADGVEVLLGHKAVQAKAGEPHTLRVEHAGESSELPFDVLLVAIGRTANVEGYGLDALDIPLRKNKTIETDEFLRTRYPNILCVGDVTGPYQLTHAGAHQAWYAAVNALFGGFKSFRADYSVMPACTYTEPEQARVGLGEREAKETGTEVEVVKYAMSELDRAVAEAATAGFVKVLVAPGKDRILGATVVGERAGETIALFALAMKQGIGLDKILGTVFAYPTFAEAAKAVAGERRKRHKPDKLLDWVERYHRWQRGGP
ncbi:FAD-dependent oxidoreductase [Luteimonas vadosa]|uniref:Bifunctional TVP38/TMEM64 family protein/FAD-dependent oxidoreductase n=1 Tax=Luteimonas vadosa TaxID=1165507 RepID=A0ABP9DPH1_9GAMM